MNSTTSPDLVSLNAPKTALVVGASSGMGAALVRQLAREGYAVCAVARRADKLEELAREVARTSGSHGGRVVVYAHDVAEVERVPELFERIVRELGGLELVIYAAGVMPKIGLKEYDTEKDLDQLLVNVGGCIAWCNAAANLFQTTRHGTIVGISSIAGDRGRKGNPVYCTTKAAMNTYLEALRNRLSECGVHVTTIKPGFVDTVMTQGLPGLFWLISAERAAEMILSAARSKANTRYVPRRWWFVGTVIKCIPSFMFKKLNV
ncbi:MAG: SDR family NAD(P)-dependent oxidoreductase [Planctomycetes bacterium]|nr:SDR family NAD(P)-dependent oxidoreductase [Planctomycetota bacterium]